MFYFVCIKFVLIPLEIGIGTFMANFLLFYNFFHTSLGYTRTAGGYICTCTVLRNKAGVDMHVDRSSYMLHGHAACITFPPGQNIQKFIVFAVE